jgi:hypothetical protein
MIGTNWELLAPINGFCRHNFVLAEQENFCYQLIVPVGAINSSRMPRVRH